LGVEAQDLDHDARVPPSPAKKRRPGETRANAGFHFCHDARVGNERRDAHHGKLLFGLPLGAARRARAAVEGSISAAGDGDRDYDRDPRAATATATLELGLNFRLEREPRPRTSTAAFHLTSRFTILPGT
jgi:hypothetical protein